MKTVVLILCFVGFIVQLFKWLNVAQKEHYLSFNRSIIRWAKLPESVVMLVSIFGFAGLSVYKLYFALVSVIVACLYPLLLPLRGAKFTRRLIFVTLGTVLIFALLTLFNLIIIQQNFKSQVEIVIVMLTPFLIEIVLTCLRPLENILSRNYVKKSEKRLEKVKPITVAITGSYGKTSTKFLLNQLISSEFETAVSPASYNNRAGITKTVLDVMTDSSQVLIAEIGTYGKGEINSIVSWLKPTIVAITAIGPVHLERMKSLENILRFKSEIFLNASTVVLNIDDDYLRSIKADLLNKTVITCSSSVASEATVVVDSNNNEIRVDGQIYKYKSDTNIPSSNLAIAIGMGIALGVSGDILVSNISNVQQVRNRSSIGESEGGVYIIDDTFNSNPAGALMALEIGLKTLNSSKAANKLYYVTPGMVELGKIQFAENEKIAKLVKDSGGELIVVGRTNKKALLAGYGSPKKFRKLKNAVSHVKSVSKPGDVVIYENDLPSHYP